MQRGSWFSEIDAAALSSYEGGLRLSLGMSSPASDTASAAKEWSQFFTFRRHLIGPGTDATAARSKTLWGTAQQTATDTGLTEASNAVEPRQGQFFIMAGTSYRLSIAQSESRYQARQLSSSMCEWSVAACLSSSTQLVEDQIRSA